MENIAKARARAGGLTQEQLAEKLGVSFQAVSEWENGRSFPDVPHLKALCETLDVSADSLLWEENYGWTPSSRLFDPDRQYTFLKAKAAALSLPMTLKAMEFARENHKDVRRDSVYGESTPYIVHPLTAACHALAMGLTDDGVLSALLLHDVVEDCGVPPEKLPVSERVREAVKLVSYNTYPGPKEEIKPLYYANIAKNPLACLVKCADRCSNLSEMAMGFSRPKLAEYVRSTEQYVLPLLDVVKRQPEWNNAAFLLGYQMRALLETYKRLLPGEARCCPVSRGAAEAGK